eukprot:scaffold200042_cov39-Attheya_sp.AAC.1
MGRIIEQLVQSEAIFFLPNPRAVFSIGVGIGNISEWVLLTSRTTPPPSSTDPQKYQDGHPVDEFEEGQYTREHIISEWIEVCDGNDREKNGSVYLQSPQEFA